MSRLGRALAAGFCLVGLLALLGVAGCGAEDATSSLAGDEVCLDGEAYALDPASGVCVRFGDACALPAGWTPCRAAEAPCASDDECALTAHCAGATAELLGRCQANALCADQAACAGAECVAGAPHDCPPDDLTCPTLGVCARPLSPGAPLACASSADCGADQVCPAELGACSADLAGGCPSFCEPACVTDADCGEGHCNVAEVCVGALADSLDCRGFCE